MPLDSSTSIPLTVTGVSGGTVQTVTFNVWDENIEENYARDSLKDCWAARTIVMLASDRNLFVNLIASGGTSVSGTYALYYFTYPEAPFLVFSSIKFDLIPVNGLYIDGFGLVTAQYVRARIMYKPLPWPTGNGTTASTLRVNFGVQLKTIPNLTGNPLYKFSDGTYLLAPFVIRVGVANIELTVFNLTQIPGSTFQPLIGCVNSTTVTLYGVNGGTPTGGTFTAAPGTLLFDAPSTQETILTGGGFNWALSYNFTWRSVGWQNEVVNYGPNAGTWLPITTSNGGNPPYPIGDLNALFTSL